MQPSVTPSPPPEAEGKDEAEAAAASTGIIIGLLIGLVIGFVLGFITGARAKQLLNAAKLAPSALKTILKSLGVAPPEPGAAEEAANEDVAIEDPVQSIDDFINSDAVPGLDDHPDLEFSPVFMYKVKVAKEEARREKRRQQLLTEGYDPDQMDDEDAQAAAAGGDKKNALATLIEAGARVTPLVASQGAEAKLREDRRRQIKTIETYLNKNMELDVTKSSLHERKTAASSKGKKYLSALDAARLTTVKRAGSEAEERALLIATVYAKGGRNQLRELMLRDPQKFKDLEPAVEMVRKKAIGEDASSTMTAADLASLVLAADDNDDDADEDLENDEQGQGDDDEDNDENGLAA